MSAIVRFFQDGGAFMYPILFVFAFGVAIAVDNHIPHCDTLAVR